MNINVEGTPPSLADIELERAMSQGQVNLVQTIQRTELVIAVIGAIAALVVFFISDPFASVLIFAAVALLASLVYGLALGVDYDNFGTQNLVSHTAISIALVIGFSGYIDNIKGNLSLVIVTSLISSGILFIRLVLWNSAFQCYRKNEDTQDAPKESCLEIRQWSGVDIVNDYLNAVIDMGRKLTNAEFAALKSHMDKHKSLMEEKSRDQEIEHACREVYLSRLAGQD